jgi:hypothetical protein
MICSISSINNSPLSGYELSTMNYEQKTYQLYASAFIHLPCIFSTFSINVAHAAFTAGIGRYERANGFYFFAGIGRANRQAHNLHHAQHREYHRPCTTHWRVDAFLFQVNLKPFNLLYARPGTHHLYPGCLNGTWHFCSCCPISPQTL